MTLPKSPLNLHALQGTWYIHYSDFPMWLKGDKQYPTFTYTVQRRKGVAGLKDEVRYWKNNKAKSINGFDTPDETIPNSFVWRGDGLLALLKSRWEIVYIASDATWAIIHFEKTLFTPEGYDVIARTEQLTPTMEQNIQGRLQALGLGGRLKKIPQG